MRCDVFLNLKLVFLLLLCYVSIAYSSFKLYAQYLFKFSNSEILILQYL